MEDKDSRALAKQFGMTILESIPIEKLSPDLSKKVPYPFAKKHLLLPIEEGETMVKVAIADPLNLNGLDELRLMLDKKIEAVLASEEHVLEAINFCYHHKEGATKELIADLSEEAELQGKKDNSYDLLDQKDEAPIIRLLNLILSEAIQQGASDIHFEPFEDDLQIRYRIDGVLQSRHAPASEYQAQLLTRIKVMAKLDIAEHRLPQDGRIKLHMGGQEIDCRVSTVPVTHGERIVLRILDKRNVVLGLDKIGMLPSTMDAFRRLMALSEG